MHTPHLKRLAKYALFCAPLAVVACDDDDTVTPPAVVDNSPSVVLSGNDNFSSLVTALTDANLVATVDGLDSATVFAPNNAAFAAVDLSGVSDADLRATLLYHVVGGTSIEASQILGSTSPIVVRASDNSTPSLVVEHDGTNVTVNNANVVTADIATDNGVAHEIDQVLMMPDVVDLATYFDGLSSLVTALTDVQLVEALREAEDVTVFAPTNTAFSQTPTTGLSSEQIADILRLHVVPAVAFSGELRDSMMVPTLVEDEMLLIRASGSSPSGFTVQGSNGIARNIMTVDVRGTNGVVHTIDGVLLAN